MPFVTNLARAKKIVLFAAVATIICSALSASPLFGPSRAALREDPVSETIQVYAGDCVTAQTVFSLGDTVCVRAGEFPLAPDAAEHYRRINYSAPGLDVVETATVRADPHYDRFRIPESGDFARPGTWRVQTVDIETNARADARFVVRHPFTRFTDLHVWKQGPDSVIPGSRVRYRITLRNDGPDMGEQIKMVEEVPSNATFLTLKQGVGEPLECSTPEEGGTGQIVCGLSALKPDAVVTLDVYYVIDARAREGESCEGATAAYSRTEELNKFDNDTRYASLIRVEHDEEQPPPDPEP